MDLNNSKKKIEKARDKFGLDPDETVRAASIANPKGFTGAVAAGGVVGAAIHAKVTSNKGADNSLASMHPGGRCMLGLTDRRLVSARSSFWTGKPKEPYVSWKLEDVSGFDVSRGVLSLVVTLTFSDDSSVQMVLGRGAGASKFVTSYEELPGPRAEL